MLVDAQRAHNLPFKAKQLFTLAGREIRSPSDLKDTMEVVVGCGEPFKANSSSALGNNTKNMNNNKNWIINKNIKIGVGILWSEGALPT